MCTIKMQFLESLCDVLETVMLCIFSSNCPIINPFERRLPLHDKGGSFSLVSCTYSSVGSYTMNNILFALKGSENGNL